MNNKKQLLLSIGLVLILVLMIVGISYAAFKFVGEGKKPNTITTGAITMEYTESTNTISMTGALPTTDTTGKVRLTKGEYFDFTIKSNIKGNTNINWEIAAEDITPSSAKKMAGKNIKLYLTKLDSTGAETQVMAPKVYNASTSANTKTGRPSGVMSLATGTMSTSETTNYRLRMYVDEDYNPQGDGGGLSFSVKINAYGKTGKKMPVGSKMKAYVTQTDLNNQNFTPQTDFHTDAYKSKITTITTKKDNIVPATAVERWDISEAGDGSVMAYVEDDGSGNSTYKLTIGGKGGIIANESMISYFTDFREMTSIDLSAFDTSEVTNMGAMFGGCSRLTSLDVSKFDTSNVTDMSGMFAYCRSLTSLDVSNFDTSQVTNMYEMFSECRSLTSLDVSKFDTSEVTDMSWIFSGCSSLTSLDVSKFDTSEVTDMSCMFDRCSSLTSLDVRNFDTSKVTDMSDMFCKCPAWNTVNQTKFAGANDCRLE
jgi:surface protein